MKILDKYIAKSFLIGYVISFLVLIGLRIIIDLFVNIDEFIEHEALTTFEVIKNILIFYGLNITLYFRDFAGMITVFAAAFTFVKMIRQNELIAMMSSGISLKRLISPVLILAIILTAVLVIDQEFLIPPLSDRLVRSHDALPGQESYDVWFITDDNGSLICSKKLDIKTSTLFEPTIITRRKKPDSLIWEVTGRIDAEKAVYNNDQGKWELTKGTFTKLLRNQNPASAENDSHFAVVSIDSYTTDLTPKDIPVRRKAEYKTMLSSRQLAALAAQKTKIRDLAQLYSQKHFRVTEPVINLLMLMVCMPILLCRDPKTMKTSVMISFSITGVVFIVTFACKLLASEYIFDKIIPEFWAWLPIFIFAPIAFLELDSMKT